MEFEHKKWGLSGLAEIFTISDPKTNFEVQLTNFGATLVRVKMPDNHAHVDDIIFGQTSPEKYEEIGGYFGASVGRVANRIADGKFTLEGKKYQLAQNNQGKHCLHGGVKGFSYRYWNLIEFKSRSQPNEVQLTFEYISPNGEENFPGELTTRITYTISPMQIAWEFHAFSNAPTIVNLTNHTYWNLHSLHTTINNHTLKLHADKVNLADEIGLPTGEIQDIAQSKVDFRNGKRLQEILDTFGDVDNNFFLTPYRDKSTPHDIVPIGELFCPETGRYMKVATSEPCVQVYTGNYMARLQSFGIPCVKYNGICLETQRMPNAINVPEFRDQVILNPGEQYFHKTVHTFGVVI